jgi:transcriptional regulator with XRE-family HTH domain
VIVEEDYNVAAQQKRRPSLGGQALKRYREQHRLTQEQLAETLKIEPRTLRAYENGERQLNQITELRRIANALDLAPEQLGIAAEPRAPRTPEQLNERLAHAWRLMDEPRIDEARLVIEELVTSVSAQVDHMPALLSLLAQVHHAAGYMVGMGTRTQEIALPLHHYHEMEQLARLIGDHTLLSLALTYQGDMFRRRGDLGKAVIYLEAACDHGFKADISARGNAYQLLGRTYLLTKNKRGFERAMAEAEGLAYQIAPETDCTRGQYNLAAVYEEYGKNYGMLGQPLKGMEYLARAEAIRPRILFWETLLKIARAELFIYSGDVTNGLPLASEAAAISQQQGHRRRLERIYGMKRHLSRKALEYGRAEMELSEILEGPLGLRAIDD